MLFAYKKYILCEVMYPASCPFAKASFSGLRSPYQLSFLPLVFPASQQPGYPVVRGRNISNKTQNTNINIGLQCPQKIISRPRNFESEIIEENNFPQHLTYRFIFRVTYFFPPNSKHFPYFFKQAPYFIS